MECSLRRWRADDAKALAEAMNNKKVQDNLRDGIPYPYTEADAAAFIQAMLEADDRCTIAFAITQDDCAIGSIGVFRKENIHYRTAEMGYYIGEPYWGRGIGASAVCQMVDHVFETTDILRIFAEPFASNMASCRVLEKVGFQREGVLRLNAVKNGVPQDMMLYSRIKD